MRKKISIAQYNEKHKDVIDAKKELSEAEASFAVAEECLTMDNCPKCKGVGEVEAGTGDPAYNPYGYMTHRECPDCEGKGYIE